MPKDLTALFNPKSVAVIGASRSPQKVGAVVYKGIIDSQFTGKLYPVNPNAEDIDGVKCYPNITSLPEVPDLAVVAIPAAVVPVCLEEIGTKGIKNVIVMSAGFKETGPEGEKLEKELEAAVKKFDLNLLGPNCMGYVNTLCPINVTFARPAMVPGNIRFISQSGAIAASLFDWCQANKLGFGEFVTLGNKAVLNETQILNYFKDHPNKLNGDSKGLSSVNPIGLYLESIIDGTEFTKVAGALSRRDPVFVIKPGKTSAGIQAMQSHTGAMAGEDSVLGAALEQAGVIRCDELEEFFDLARAFAWENVPEGPSIAVVSNSGGPGVITADAVMASGLELVQFDPETKAQLAEVLPRSASLLNPVDVLGDALADRYAKAAEIILEKGAADALIFILTPLLMTEIEKTAEIIGRLSEKYQKPIFCSFIGGSMIEEGEKKLDEFRVPSFRFPERAVYALSAMWKWKKYYQKKEDIVALFDAVVPDQEKLQNLIDSAKKKNQKALDSVDVNELLSVSGLSVPPSDAAATFEEARDLADTYGWPVVLKISSPGLLHKQDVGGVVTGINDVSYLERAWDKLERKISELDEEIKKHVRIQVQKEVLFGQEVIVGVKKDPTFGPVLLFGAGGSLAELIQDRNLHILPINDSQVEEFISKSKIFTVLKGHRGHPPYAVEKLKQLILRLSDLAQALPDIQEIEINPVIVTLSDVWAVDGKLLLKEGKSKLVAPPKFQVAKTLEHEILATTYHYYTFETETPLKYAPGQYLSVKVANDRINCYSVAGHESDTNFHLLVDTSPGGPGSKFFENLKVGDKVTYLGPYGTFQLKPDDGAKHLVLLVTGCGFAPMKSIIEAALRTHQMKIPVTLYLGFRSVEDVFWKDYFDSLVKEFPNFSYKLAVDKAAEGCWSGHIGYITDLIKEDFADMKDFSAYLCGSKPMVAAATALLEEKGCLKEKIYTEKV